MPLTQGTIAYATGIHIPGVYWKNFCAFPALFSDKVSVVCKGVDDQRKRDINKILIQRCMSLAAAFIGYGTGINGYKMPKIKVVCDYRGLDAYMVTYIDKHSEVMDVEVLAADSRSAMQIVNKTYGEALKVVKTFAANAQHIHYRKRSWSHNIDLFFNELVECKDTDFDNLLGTIIHEMIHSKQITTRRLCTSSGGYKWDGKSHEYIDQEDGKFDLEAYNKLPWEAEAYTKTPEILANIQTFLTTGLVRGFNPKRV